MNGPDSAAPSPDKEQATKEISKCSVNQNGRITVMKVAGSKV